MSRRWRVALKPLLGWAALATLALVSLWLFQLSQVFHPWGQERTQALLALAGLLLGVVLASGRGIRRASAAPTAPPTPAAAVATTNSPNPLSPREQELLALVDAGLSNKEIARHGGISENTVKTHLARIFEKLGARRRTEALALARQRGWLEPLTHPGDTPGANG